MTKKEIIEKLEFFELPNNGFFGRNRMMPTLKKWHDVVRFIEEIKKVLKNSEVLDKPFLDKLTIFVIDINKVVEISHLHEPGSNRISEEEKKEIEIRVNSLHKNIYGINYVGTEDDTPLYAIAENLRFQKERAEIGNLSRSFEKLRGFDYISKFEEIETHLSKLKEESAKVASEKYARVFHEEAGANKRRAYIWLGAGIVFLLTFILSFNTLNTLLFPSAESLKSLFDAFELTLTNPSYLIWISILSRALAIALGFFVLRFIARHYNVQRHLYTENKHRASALDAFKLFFNSLDQTDSTSRSTLILEVARAISQPARSGYLGNKSDYQTNVPYSDLVKLLGSNVPKS